MMQFSAHTQAQLELGRDQIVDRYLGKGDPNIVGVGLSFRQRCGEWTGEPVVTVLVEKKRPEALISVRKLLPKTVEVNGRRWGIDVEQSGPMPTRGTVAPTAPLMQSPDGPINERMRPPRQGCSISNGTVKGTGTYSATVIDLTDNTICLLSNNHVIGRDNQARPGEPIIQPGTADTDAREPIGRFKRLVPIDPKGTDIDAAIAQLDAGVGSTDLVAHDLMPPVGPAHPAIGILTAGDPFAGAYLTSIDVVRSKLRIKFPNATASSTATKTPQVGMHVEKVGRTTGYTSSYVRAVGLSANVGGSDPLGTVRYDNLTPPEAGHATVAAAIELAALGALTFLGPTPEPRASRSTPRRSPGPSPTGWPS